MVTTESRPNQGHFWRVCLGVGQLLLASFVGAPAAAEATHLRDTYSYICTPWMKPSRLIHTDGQLLNQLLQLHAFATHGSGAPPASHSALWVGPFQSSRPQHRDLHLAVPGSSSAYPRRGYDLAPVPALSLYLHQTWFPDVPSTVDPGPGWQHYTSGAGLGLDLAGPGNDHAQASTLSRLPVQLVLGENLGFLFAGGMDRIRISYCIKTTRAQLEAFPGRVRRELENWVTDHLGDAPDWLRPPSVPSTSELLVAWATLRPRVEIQRLQWLPPTVGLGAWLAWLTSRGVPAAARRAHPALALLPPNAWELMNQSLRTNGLWIPNHSSLSLPELRRILALDGTGLRAWLEQNARNAAYLEQIILVVREQLRQRALPPEA